MLPDPELRHFSRIAKPDVHPVRNTLTGSGIAIDLAVAAGLMRLMKSLLFGVSPLDTLAYVSVLIVLTASAVLASYLPARRAAGVNPVEALRAE